MKPAPRAVWAQLRQWWDRVSLYLPVLLMGLLALGSYWALRNSPTPAPPKPAQALRHDPDYIMRDFSVRTYDAQGLFKNQLFGDEARHYPDTDTLEVDRPRIRSLHESGHWTTITAGRLTTQAGRTEHLLEQQVVAVREPLGNRSSKDPRLEYRSEQLRFYTDTERLESEWPVEMFRGSDRITADRLLYDNRIQIAELQGRVRATLLPRQATRP